jgi:hypothetical protein
MPHVISRQIRLLSRPIGITGSSSRTFAAPWPDHRLWQHLRQYAVKPVPGPTNLFNITTKRLTMKGLMVFDWLDHQAEFRAEVGGYFQAGTLQHNETMVQGIDHAVSAFLGLFQGKTLARWS